MIKPTFMTALMLFVSLVAGVRTQYASAKEYAETAADFVAYNVPLSDGQRLAFSGHANTLRHDRDAPS